MGATLEVPVMYRSAQLVGSTLLTLTLLAGPTARADPEAAGPAALDGDVHSDALDRAALSQAAPTDIDTTADDPAVLPDGDALADGRAIKTAGRKKARGKKGTAPAARAAHPDARPATGVPATRKPSPVEPRAAAQPRLRPPDRAAARRTPERDRRQSALAARRASVAHRPALTHATRPYRGHVPAHVRPWYTRDHRYARPHWRYLRPNPHAHHGPPGPWFYRPWYTHWWLHPFWRYTHATQVIVHFDFVVHAWSSWWVPPPRPGWVWVPGHWSHGHWIPGHWRPVARPPVRHGVTYVYVPGGWIGDVYIEGFWRPSVRDDGDWVWVDGYYLADGTWVPGYWRPAGYAPEGYVWVPGFFDGETWVGGFWRPEFYPGYVWVPGSFDDDGLYHAGYWEPVEDRPGYIWIPGWFDGTEWIPGYWVSEEEYKAADPDDWQPDEGCQDGWEEDDTPTIDEPAVPLALPVEVPDDE